jgi:hypothetical protein
MSHSAEFVGIGWRRNKILSVFTEAVKGTVYQKISLMAVKLNLKFGII